MDEQEIFIAAVERDAAARRDYLDEACAGNPELRRRVEGLLAAHDNAAGFLDHPAGELAPTTGRPITEGPGQTIGRYKLLEEIGEGGMGIVYMAEQRQPVRRKVALKIIKPGMDSREVITRFEAERQALALMDHPNVARVLDGGATRSGRPYFVMDLVQGIPITEYCDQARLTTRQRLDLFVLVCQAVQHAHQKGIIHRDLKPSNVLVTLHDGVPVPKIIDFGIAKATRGQLTEKTLFTGLGRMMGTPLYMSPEQAEMSGLDVDTRSDIYSLGVLLYELLTGSTPFDKERLREAGYDEVRRVIREEEPPLPSHRLNTLCADAISTIPARRGVDARRLGRLLRGDLDWIVMKALEKDRTRRYESASAFAADVERYLAHEPVQARPPTLADRAAKWARRHRPVAWSAAVLLALSTVTLALSTVLIAQARREAMSAYEETAEQLGATERAEQLAKRQEQLARQQEALAREQHKLAEAQKEEAVKQRDISERNLYVAHMRLAQRDWEQGQVGRLRGMLDAHFPHGGRADLRAWEWYYCLALCHSERLTVYGHNHEIRSVVWSPNGENLATASVDNTARIWDASSGKELRTLSGHAQAINSVDWSSDGRNLATASSDRTVRIWDAATGGQVRTLSGHTGIVSSAVWSPECRRLASGGEDGNVRIWDPTTGKATLSWIAHDAEIHKLVWSPDGKRLASRSRDGNGLVKIWDVTNGKEIRALRGSGAFLSTFAWSPDGRRIALDSPSRGIQIYDSETGEKLESLDNPPTLLYGLAWSPDGRRLAIVGSDTVVRIWDMASRHQVRAYRGHTETVTAVAWSPDGARLASASVDRTAKIWDAGEDQESRTLGLASGVGSMAWMRDGRLATTSADRVIKIWETASGQAVSSLVGPTDVHSGAAWSPDGRRLASPGGDGTVQIWDAAAGKVGRTLKAHRGPVSSVAWSPDGGSLASAGRDRSVRIWDPAGGRETLRVPGRHGEFVRLAWDPEGKRLAASGEENGTLTVWDAATGKSALVLNGASHWHNVVRPAWSPDGRQLASEGSEGRVVHVWSAADGRELLRLPGHTELLSAVAWHPDGRRLTSADHGGTIRIWDLASGQEVLMLRTQRSPDLAWSDDGQRLAATSGTSVVIWDASTGFRMAPRAQYDLSRRLSREGRHDDALLVLHELVEKFPSVPEYRQPLANAYFDRADEPFHRDDFEKALPDLERAIQYDPEYSEAYDHRGSLYLARGDLDRAVADYDRAIRFGPAYPALTYPSRAAAYLAKGELDKADADLAKAIDVAADSVIMWYYRALVQLTAGRPEKYRADCAEMLRRVGQAPDARWACWIAWTCGLAPGAVADWSQPIALAEKAVQNDPKSAWCVMTLGAVLYRAGRCADAIQRLEEADRLVSLANVPANVSAVHAWFFLAMAHRRLGHDEQAKHFFAKAAAWTDSALRGTGAEKHSPLTWRGMTLNLLRAEAAQALERTDK